MPHPMPPLSIRAYTATSALGRGLEAHAEALHASRGGLTPNDFSSAPLDCWIGRVAGLEDAPLPPELAQWDCRNNRLAWLALNQDGFMEAVRDARERYGASRVAVAERSTCGRWAIARSGCQSTRGATCRSRASRSVRVGLFS